MTLMSGTIFAQVVAMAASLVLARIFSPEAYGGIAIFTSVTGVIVTVASLRYEVAIMLPKTNDDARVVYRLASRSIAIVCLLATVVFVAASPWVADHFDDVALSRWLMLGGLSAYFLAQINAISYWLNRHTRYRTIAANKMQQSLGTAGGQIGLGLAGLVSMTGLVLGQILGQAWAWARLVRHTPELRGPLPEGGPSVRDMARRYRRMPLLTGPAALLDSLRLNGINLLVATYAVSALGQFNMAWRLLQAPVMVINGAVQQVFLQRLAAAVPGEMTRLVRAAVGRSAAIGVVPFAFLWMISPWLFPFVLGEQWDRSGDFARALTPWLYMQLVTAPISTVFVVAEKQQRMLVFSAVFCVLPLSLLAFSPWDLLTTTYLLGALMAAMLVMMVVMTDVTAREYDRTGSVRASEGDRP
ncbi:oligosaccharide flippase family protein [Georgenia sp. EYE_87]|nr:oligosaccharide flippase family protein [Georgenia sp. EYE_87]